MSVKYFPSLMFVFHISIHNMFLMCLLSLVSTLHYPTVKLNSFWWVIRLVLYWLKQQLGYIRSLGNSAPCYNQRTDTMIFNSPAYPVSPVNFVVFLVLTECHVFLDYHSLIVWYLPQITKLPVIDVKSAEKLCCRSL